MSAIPDYVRILGIDFSIETSSELGDWEQAGICRLHSNEIVLNPCVESQGAVLLHEMVEAINHHLELKMKHRQISAISSAMYSALIDNPLLLGYLLSLSDDVEV